MKEQSFFVKFNGIFADLRLHSTMWIWHILTNFCFFRCIYGRSCLIDTRSLENRLLMCFSAQSVDHMFLMYLLQFTC
uniref:Uncharacterized protein n=1 Tax=Setaria italica TaxID=4555 RepID=K3ZKR4_SETIT